jgi:heme-degrading monooxygenase HmoA
VYAVIFTSKAGADREGYGHTAARMVELARKSDGFLGLESVSGADGLAITVSYFRSVEAIAAWRADAEHRVAQAEGRKRWYEAYHVVVARVERDATFGPAEAVASLGIGRLEH